jgi:hypothetical protein
VAESPTPDAAGEEREADPEDSKAVWDLEGAEASAVPDFSGESMSPREKKPSAVPATIPRAKRIGDFMMNGGRLGLLGKLCLGIPLYQDAERFLPWAWKKG